MIEFRKPILRSCKIEKISCNVLQMVRMINYAIKTGTPTRRNNRGHENWWAYLRDFTVIYVNF